MFHNEDILSNVIIMIMMIMVMRELPLLSGFQQSSATIYFFLITPYIVYMPHILNSKQDLNAKQFFLFDSLFHRTIHGCHKYTHFSAHRLYRKTEFAKMFACDIL